MEQVEKRVVKPLKYENGIKAIVNVYIHGWYNIIRFE